jgi:hypothetical protein
VKRTFDAGAIVVAKASETADDGLDVVPRDLSVAQYHGAFDETSFWDTAEIDDDFEEAGEVVRSVQRTVQALTESVGQYVNERGHIVDHVLVVRLCWGIQDPGVATRLLFKVAGVVIHDMRACAEVMAT